MGGVEHAEISRRFFLKGSIGLVGVSILQIPAAASGGSDLQRDATVRPGRATQRIDGLDKVTGRKIFARDFSARDMSGWPKSQWYAHFLRATTVERTFEGVDLSSLPSEARPTRVVFGDELSDALRSPRFAIDRGVHFSAVDSGGGGQSSFDNPPAVMFDLIVQRGNLPDFLGQAVVLLLFSDRDAYRRAKAETQFREDQFLVYGDAVSRSERFGQLYDPATHYVRVANGGGTEFSYAEVADITTYASALPGYQADIERTLTEESGLIVRKFDCSMQAMDPMFMEPEAGLAWLDPDAKVMHLVLGTQSPDRDVEAVNAMFAGSGSPESLSGIVLTSCFPGGGFGGRDSSPFSLMLTLVAAYSRGNPVRLAYDRFEQFRVGLKRHACSLSGDIAIDREQSIRAVRMQMTFDGGGRKNLSPWVANLAALCAGGSYNIPMADVFAKAVRSENVAGGSQRGFGGPQAFFAIETALDEIARSNDWDPIALRRKNLLAKGDRTIVGGPVDQDLRLDELLDIAEQHTLWSQREDIKADYAARGRTYGTGIAMSLQAYGTSGDGVVGGVRIGVDGTLTVLTNAVDMGNGSATTLSVVVAESLGRNASRIEMGDANLFAQTGLLTTSKLPDGARAS